MSGNMPQTPQTTLTLRQRVAFAASQTHRAPTAPQRQAGNYPKGKFPWNGHEIAIETPKGGIRTGQDRAGRTWKVTMPAHYGYIRRTLSDADGDAVDVIVGPHPESDLVCVVDQVTAGGRFDEHKAVIGCLNVREAKELYLACYSSGWKGFRSITPMTRQQFSLWLKKGDTGRPIMTQVTKKYSRRAELAAAKYALSQGDGKSDERWITIHPHGHEEGTGTPVKIDGQGRIVGGPKGIADKGIKKLSDFGGKKEHTDGGTGKHPEAKQEQPETSSDKKTPATFRWLARRLFEMNGTGPYTTADQSHWIEKAKKAVAANPETPEQLSDALVNFSYMKGGVLSPREKAAHQAILDKMRGYSFADELPKPEQGENAEDKKSPRFTVKGNEIYDSNGVRHGAARSPERAKEIADEWNANGKPGEGKSSTPSQRDETFGGGIATTAEGNREQTRKQVVKDFTETGTYKMGRLHEGYLVSRDQKKAALAAGMTAESFADEYIKHNAEVLDKSWAENVLHLPNRGIDVPSDVTETAKAILGAENKASNKSSPIPKAPPSRADVAAAKVDSGKAGPPSESGASAKARQVGLFSQRELGGAPQLFDTGKEFVKEKKGSPSPVKDAAPSKLEQIEDELKGRAAESKPLAGQKSLLGEQQPSRVDVAAARFAQGQRAVGESNGGGEAKQPRWYGMSLRPPSLGAIPKGEYEHKAHPSFRHGQISFKQPLTEQQAADYELTPIHTDADLPRLAKSIADHMGEYASQYADPENDELLDDILKQEALRKILGHVDRDKLKAEFRRHASEPIRHSRISRELNRYVRDLYARKVATGQRSFAFDENDHPRGMPGNAGEFAPKGEGKKLAKAKPSRPKTTSQTTVDMPETNTYPAMKGVKLKHADDGKTYFIHPTDDKYVLTKVPTHHVARFMDEIGGKINHPANSGHDTLDRVLSGKGKFIGKGHESLAFDAGNGMIVKAAVLSPFHINHGVRDSHEANKIVDDSVATTKALRAAGVPGIIPQYCVHHDGRSFAVQKKVDTTTPLQPKHFEQLEKTLQAMHEAGYVLKDIVQAGLDHNGNAAIYDVGSAQKLTGGRYDDEDKATDFNHLSYLARKAGVDYKTPSERRESNDYEGMIWKLQDRKEPMTPSEASTARMRLIGASNRLKAKDPDLHLMYEDAHKEVMQKLEEWKKAKPEPAKFSRVAIAAARYARETRPVPTPKSRDSHKPAPTPPTSTSGGGKNKSGGGWITLGGSHVHIGDDGKIMHGCPGLKGEHVQDLKNESQESRKIREVRQDHAQARGLTGHDVTAGQAKQLASPNKVRQHEVAKQAARGTGHSTASVLRALPDAHELHDQDRQLFRPALNRLMAMTGATPAKARDWENDQGKDWSTWPDFDHWARTVAAEHPELGLDKHDHGTPAKLWDLIRSEGRRVAADEIHSPEVARTAVEMLGKPVRGRKKASQSESESDDSGDFGDTSFDPDKFSRANLARARCLMVGAR